MEEQRIREFLEDNKSKLPLSYNDLIFRRGIKSIDPIKKAPKSVSLQFYKPITRF